MPTIGEQLRAAREARGLEIEDAHRHTKIHTKILRAMEEDRASEVLDPTYARGFLRKYAAFLNLDPTSLVEESAKADRPGATMSLTQTTPQEAPKTSGMPPWVPPSIIGIMAVIGVVFLGILTRDLSKTVTTATSAPAPTTPAKPTAAKPAPEPPAPPPAKPLVPRSQPLKLSIKASQDCWMQVKADDKVLFQNVLGKGREETWTANDTIELWVGNAAALALTLNGRALEPLGLGVQKGIRVTRYGLQLPKSSRRTP